MARTPSVLLAVAVAGLAPAGAAARTVYVTGQGNGMVTPIESSTGAKGAGIPVGAAPYAAAITPDGKRLYVAGIVGDNVTVIDVATNAVVTTVGPLEGPSDLAASPDGRQVWVTENGTGMLTPIDVATNAVGSPIAVGSQPTAVAITPDGSRAYVARGGGGVVAVDLLTSTAGPPIAVGDTPSDVAITPDGGTVYVANKGSQSVTPIAIASNAPGSEIAGLTTAPEALAIMPDGSRGLLTTDSGDNVWPITLAGNTAGAAIPVGDNPQGIAVLPDGSRAYVAINQEGGRVRPVDLATNALLDPISLSGGPAAVAIVPDQGPAAVLAEPAAAAAGSPVTLDASGSTDPDGTVVRYEWSFGDGATATTTSPTTTHSYATSGTFTAAVTVVDDEGCSNRLVFTGRTASCNGSGVATAQRAVTVGAGPAVAPPVTSPGQVLLCGGRKVALTGLERRGGRQVVSGFAAAVAGTRVTVRGDHGAGAVRTKVAADGSFTARFPVPKNPETRYQAELGGEKSITLKVSRKLELVSRKRTKAGLRITARHARGRAAAGVKATVLQQLGCGDQRIFKVTKFDRRGRVTALLPYPQPPNTVAVYRVTTPLNKTYTLPLVVERGAR